MLILVQDARNAVQRDMAIVSYVTKRIADRKRCVNAPKDGRENIAPLLRVNTALSATPDRRAAHIMIVVRDARIAVERDMDLVNYAIRIIVHRAKSANVRMDIEANTATIRPARDCVVM